MVEEESNPKDTVERYRKLVGKKVRLPLMNREIPVVWDDVMAQGMFEAGMQLALEMGMLSVSTSRVIQFSEDELRLALRTAPKEFTLGIGKDSRVIIKTRGLMGEKYVDITPSLKYSDSPPERIYGENVARLDDVMQKAGASFDRLNSILDKVDRGEGTLGKLATDKKLYDNLAGLSLELRQIADSVNNGEGSIGKLIHSDEPYNRIVSVLNRADATLADLQSRDGTFGRLIRDREMYDKGLALVSRADSAVQSFEDVAAKLHSKEGSAGKMLNDQEAYDKLVKMIESIDALVKDIKANPKKYVKLSLF